MIKLVARFLMLIMLFSIGQMVLAQTPKILKPDEAFQLSTQSDSGTQLILHWQIAPGYHLYSDAITVKVLEPSNVKLAPLVLPKGKPNYDPTRGHFMAYYHSVTIPVTLTAGNTQNLTLLVSYQGCADMGLCLPPQHKTLRLNASFNLQSLIKESTNANSIETIFHAKQPFVVLLSFFVFGVLLSFTPCVFPMLPILSGIIASHGQNITSRHAFSLSFVYVLFSALTYAVLGIIAGVAGHHLQSALQNNLVLILSGILFIVLAFSLFGLYEIRLPNFLQSRLTHLSHMHGGGSLLGVALMGIFSTLVVSPCVSAPLVGALAYIGDTGSAAFGGIALFVLGFGMGLPLLLIGTSAGKLLPKTGHWMVNIKNFFGLLLVAMAIWIWARVLPVGIIVALWAILAVTCAVCLGAFEPAKTYWNKFCKALGILLGLYGICLFIGVISGSTNMLQPLEKLANAAPSPNAETSQSTAIKFIRVENFSQLKRVFIKHPRVILDFYANWCVSCKQMESEVFGNSEVQKTLQKYQVQMVQVDLTDSNKDLEFLTEKYQVIAPPTLLFFNNHGDWISNANLVGDQSADGFAQAVEDTYSNDR